MYCQEEKVIQLKTEKAVDQVMKRDVYCCHEECLYKWKKHFGSDLAREIIATERTVEAGMDSVQRMLYHEGRLRANLEYILKTPVVGQHKVKVGKQPASPPNLPL